MRSQLHPSLIPASSVKLLAVAFISMFLTARFLMSIDLGRERPISFNEASKFLPNDYRPHASTWWRWWRVGLKNGKQRIHLETVVLGNRRFTTAEAVQRFAAALRESTMPRQNHPDSEKRKSPRLKIQIPFEKAVERACCESNGMRQKRRVAKNTKPPKKWLDS